MEEKCLAVFWGPLHIIGLWLNPRNVSGVTTGTNTASLFWNWCIQDCTSPPLPTPASPLLKTCSLLTSFGEEGTVKQSGQLPKAICKAIFYKIISFFSPASASLAATLQPRKLPAATKELCSPSKALPFPQHANSPHKEWCSPTVRAKLLGIMVMT